MGRKVKDATQELLKNKKSTGVKLAKRPKQPMVKKKLKWNGKDREDEGRVINWINKS